MCIAAVGVYMDEEVILNMMSFFFLVQNLRAIHQNSTTYFMCQKINIYIGSSSSTSCRQLTKLVSYHELVKMRKRKQANNKMKTCNLPRYLEK